MRLKSPLFIFMADLYLGEFDEIHRPCLPEGKAKEIAEFLIQHCTEDEAVEYVIDLMILAYIRGKRKAADDLMLDYIAWYEYIYEDVYRMNDVIFKVFDKKTVEDRIREYYQQAEENRMAVVIDTEYHRDYQTGGTDMADIYTTKTGKPAYKKWNTMLDDRVRDTHDYLEGMEVGISDRFYTYDGDSALAPGGFENPDNNVNCRCWLTFGQGSPKNADRQGSL